LRPANAYDCAALSLKGDLLIIVIEARFEASTLRVSLHGVINLSQRNGRIRDARINQRHFDVPASRVHRIFGKLSGSHARRNTHTVARRARFADAREKVSGISRVVYANGISLLQLPNLSPL